MKNGDCTGFIGRPGSKEKPRMGLSHASTKPRAATDVTGSPEKDAGGGAVVVTLFTIITRLPSVLKSKLLPNLYNNSKISKNKSCSKSKVLQPFFL